MPQFNSPFQQPQPSVENNFTQGLKTEFTGLNFPENAATDCDNCIFTLVGDVLRRQGFDFEYNYAFNAIDRRDQAVSYFKWRNAGGDGTVQILALQVGAFLHFYRTSTATLGTPASTQVMPNIIPLNNFHIDGSGLANTTECQYAEGNGYLFVFHPNLQPFYVIYTGIPGTEIIVTGIDVQIRDFDGVIEPELDANTRPVALTNNHKYNLQNQGWTAGPSWSGTSTTSNTVGLGSKTFIVQAGLTAAASDLVDFYSDITAPDGTHIGNTYIMSGTVTSYAGTTLIASITAVNELYEASVLSSWQVSQQNLSHVLTWNAAIHNFPSNADVWWNFKNASGVFDPATTVNNRTYNSGPAPKGAYVLDAFVQRRDIASSISSIANVAVFVRPRTGSWFQGRLWFAGVDGRQALTSTGSNAYYSWTENIYFSRIIRNTSEFGVCYQNNDPTSETSFDLLPDDGGLIKIPGCGPIHKLFPLQTGMLVFATNGIWFITGSSGLGFTANDYTIIKIASIQTLSATSIVDVLGFPYFWNEEGIYAVELNSASNNPASARQRQEGLVVNPITVGTILSFYNNIPLGCKKFARGDYDPVNYTIQWTYNSFQEHINDFTQRYEFDRILCYNTANKAFYPYSIARQGLAESNIPPGITPHIHGVAYITNTGGEGQAIPTFKYISSVQAGSTYLFTFSEERDATYLDWRSYNTIGQDYISYFITGYKLHTQAQRRGEIEYLYLYNKNDLPTSYKIQALWDFANDRNSNRFSTPEYVTNTREFFSNIFRRHRIRGHGQILQLKVSSVTGKPFDIIGWSMLERQNTSI